MGLQIILCSRNHIKNIFYYIKQSLFKFKMPEIFFLLTHHQKRKKAIIFFYFIFSLLLSAYDGLDDILILRLSIGITICRGYKLTVMLK